MKIAFSLPQIYIYKNNKEANSLTEETDKWAEAGRQERTWSERMQLVFMELRSESSRTAGSPSVAALQSS